MSNRLFFCGVLVLILAVYIAISPLFKLNLDRPLKANFIELPDSIPLDGNLKPNDLLTKALYIAHKQIRGAESIVFDKNGFMYTGLLNGQIVRIEENGNVKKIVQMGDETNETICNAPHGSPKCGRPLGLRIKNETLYVCDAYYGLFKVNLIEGTKQQILSSSDKRFGKVPLKFVNDLDLDSDSNIYFVDTSYVRGVDEALEEHVEAVARGRLFRYNELNDELETLLENLYFPNGVQLTPSKDAVLINENTMARIIKYFISGDKKGTKELFTDLPGYSDNIRLTNHHTLLVPFAIVRENIFGSFLDLFGRYPFIRTLIGYFVDLGESYKIVPKYGLIVEYDLNGKPIRSWHDPTGKVIGSCSQVELHNNKMYLGNLFIDYIAVIDY